MADPSNTFKTHWSTLKTLKGKKRREFIWEYYKPHMIVIALAVAFTAYIIYGALHPAKKAFVNVAFYGVMLQTDTEEAIAAWLDDALLEQLFDEVEADKYKANVDYYDINSPDLNMAAAMTQKFTANVFIRDIDVIIAPAEFSEALEAQGVSDESETVAVGGGFIRRFDLDPNYGWRAFVIANAKHPDEAAAVMELITK